MDIKQITKRRIAKTQMTLNRKREEYADDQSPFRNFYRGATLLGHDDPERAAWGYITKHLVSIQDMVEGLKKPTRELIDEKFGDTICYLTLILAMHLDPKLDTDKMKEAIKLLKGIKLDRKEPIKQSCDYHMMTPQEWVWERVFNFVVFFDDAIHKDMELLLMIGDIILLEAILTEQLDFDPRDNSYKEMASKPDPHYSKPDIV